MDEVSTTVATPVKKRTRRTAKKTVIPTVVAEVIEEAVIDTPSEEMAAAVISTPVKAVKKRAPRAKKKVIVAEAVPEVALPEAVPEEVLPTTPPPTSEEPIAFEKVITKRVITRKPRATRKISAPKAALQTTVKKSKAIAASLAPVSIENPIARELVLLSPFRFPIDYTQLAAQTARYSGLFYVLVGAFFTVYHAGSVTPIALEGQDALLATYNVGGGTVFSGDVMLLVLSVATIAIGLLLMLIGFHLGGRKEEVPTLRPSL